MKPKVFFYVQHLWGVGHVYRATRIAKGLLKHGFEVHLVWGGTRILGFDFEGINIHYLTAVRTSDVSFSQLLNEQYEVFTDDDEKARCKTLLDLFDNVHPDILITEAYPFGRRQMRFELLPLLERANERSKPPLIAASIRDIMQEGRKKKRVKESLDLIEQYYDIVLVHGDKKLIPIEETLQGAGHFMEKVRYTGLVTPEPIESDSHSEYSCDVLVTVGGGAFGQRLTRTALQAMRYSKQFPNNWIVSAGTELSENEFNMLLDTCPDGMRIVRYIPNLASEMKHCKVSVSHAGYNTVADILRSECRAVLYPYTGGKETEQFRRSTIMAKRGLVIHLEPDHLSSENLASAIDQAALLQPTKHMLDIEGASKSAEILWKCLTE